MRATHSHEQHLAATENAAANAETLSLRHRNGEGGAEHGKGEEGVENGTTEQAAIALYTHLLNHSSIKSCARAGKLCGPGKVNVENRSGFPIAW